MWTFINANNFLVKHKTVNSCETFWLTNLIKLWKCSCNADRLLNIFQDANKAFQFPDNDTAISQVIGLFTKDSPNINRKVTIEGDHAIVSASSCISVFTIKMSLSFDIMPPETMYEELTYYLLALTRLMFERECRLVKIIEDKDVELDEYRQEGVEIKRKGVVTAPFVFDAFNQSSMEFTLKGFTEHPATIFNGSITTLMNTLPPPPIVEGSTVNKLKEETLDENIPTKNNITAEGTNVYLDSPAEPKREAISPKKRKKMFTGLKF